MIITNRQVGFHVVNQDEFKTKNGALYAQKTANGVYVVYSYGPHFPIVACIRGTWFANIERFRGTWFANSERYAVATTRHQIAARACLHETTDVSCAELKVRISKARPENTQPKGDRETVRDGEEL